MSTVLDVRGLPPCEPFERTLAALDELAAGEVLDVLIHREPFPLYDLLRERGFTWQIASESGETGAAQFRISITRR